MHVIHRRGWEIPESQATPEAYFLNRRSFIGAAASTAALALSSTAAPAQRVSEIPDPTKDLYPARRNETYVLDRPLTDEKINGSYNNFYEYGTSKNITAAAQQLRIRPWTIKIDGLVEKPFDIGIDDLVRKVGIEERLYRHRCVEAWSMTIPWSGFQFSKLVELAKPTSAAKYVRMETFNDPQMAPGMRVPYYPWPYVEGLTMAEAANELCFLATGAYGKPIAKQHGAPIRLAIPWKYGFKAIKSIVRVSFVAERPKGLWEALQASEYGFWANVNPEVAHPRWSQATEELIGVGERRPTLLFNGYADYVAGMYKGLEGERLYV